MAASVGRRQFLQGAIGAAALAAMPLGCGVGGDSIRFWNGFTGPDGRTILKMVQQFNRQTPGVRVTLQRMGWDTYYNKLFVAGIEERGPEVFVVHSSSLMRMQRAGLLRPMDDLYADGGGGRCRKTISMRTSSRRSRAPATAGRCHSTRT